AVYTNNCYTAAFRGFGSPQVIFAQESLMDEIAQECGLTPLEIRRLNGYGQDSVTASGQRLSDHEVSLQQVLDQAVEKCDYNIRMKKYQELNKNQQLYRYGIGIACSYRGCSLGAEGTDATSAIVSVQADGSVYLLAALNENGQGLRTTFCQITAEILGVPLSRIVFLEPQTATISDGGPTVASRSTLMGGKAIELAASQVKETIFTANRDLLKTRDIGKIRWEDNKIINPGKKISIDFPEAAANAYRQGRNLSAYGWYKAPEVNWEEKTGQGNAYFTYVYGCQVVEVKVDQETGKIDILEITAAHDAGRIINRLGAEGQLQGGVVQGIGYGILEDFNQQLGTVKSVNFDEYLIPTIKDIPRINAIFVENPDKYGPFGAKSLGEPTLELTAAAINNAVSNALGRRFYELPLTLEQIFLGRHLHKPARQSEKALTTDKIGLSNASLQKCKIVTPKSFSEALRLMSEDRFRILAGGTDVLVQARHHQQPVNLINVGGFPELKKVEDIGNTIEIGSGATISKILESKQIIKYFPLLRKACSLIGSKQIRNRATIGGNIVNAAPCADSVPPLILYGASYELVSYQGKRLVSALDFTEGSYQTCIRPEEIMTKIILPKPEHRFYTAYYQLGRRNAVNITRMSISAAIAFTDNTNLVKECRLIDGAMFSRPYRLGIIENLLTGKILVSDLISEISEPLEQFCREQIGNRWSSDYKIPVFIKLVIRALKDIARERGLI
ncbi:MAG: molybdopterin-dependent oxidoreductase, partial [Candidatus Cloacimonetes bacterium]|nr:molybdopterin-dependent oxidoreductase [Candidatus Cloacimonadota bacterium]